MPSSGVCIESSGREREQSPTAGSSSGAQFLAATVYSDKEGLTPPDHQASPKQKGTMTSQTSHNKDPPSRRSRSRSISASRRRSRSHTRDSRSPNRYRRVREREHRYRDSPRYHRREDYYYSSPYRRRSRSPSRHRSRDRQQSHERSRQAYYRRRHSDYPSHQDQWLQVRPANLYEEGQHQDYYEEPLSENEDSPYSAQFSENSEEFHEDCYPEDSLQTSPATNTPLPAVPAGQERVSLGPTSTESAHTNPPQTPTSSATAEPPAQPPSPPRDPLQTIWYPPSTAEVLFEGDKIQFRYKNRHYGNFIPFYSSPLGFKIENINVMTVHVDFMTDCADEPQAASRECAASADLDRARRQLNSTLSDRFGATITTSPHPSFVHARRHPLHEDLKKALNKHRVNRTTRDHILKLLKSVEASEAKRKVKTFLEKPLTPKVPSFLNVTGIERADPILDFLNTKTSHSFDYLVDLQSMYSYLTKPTTDTLGVQHHLKERLLFYLSLYDTASAATIGIESLKTQMDATTGVQQTITNTLEGLFHLHAFSYKSLAKEAEHTAELLGAACMLLRMEATRSQITNQAEELLLYGSDIVGTHVFNLRGLEGLDNAILSGVLNVVSPSPVPGPSHPQHRGTYQNQRFRGRRGGTRETAPPRQGFNRGGGNSRNRGMARGQRRGGYSADRHKASRATGTKRREPIISNENNSVRTNASGRQHTRPAPPPTRRNK